MHCHIAFTDSKNTNVIELLQIHFILRASVCVCYGIKGELSVRLREITATFDDFVGRFCRSSVITLRLFKSAIVNELLQRLVRYCSVDDATLEGTVCFLTHILMVIFSLSDISHLLV